MDQENDDYMFNDEEIMEAFTNNEYGVKLQGRAFHIQKSVEPNLTNNQNKVFDEFMETSSSNNYETLQQDHLQESPKCNKQNLITKNQPIILEMDKEFWNKMELDLLPVADNVSQAEFKPNKQRENVYLDENDRVVTTEQVPNASRFQEYDSDFEELLPLSKLVKFTSDQNNSRIQVISDIKLTAPNNRVATTDEHIAHIEVVSNIQLEQVPNASNFQEYDSDFEDSLPLSRLVKFTSDQNNSRIQVISDIKLTAPNVRCIQEDPKPKLKRKNKAVSKDWIANKNRKLRMKGQQYLGYRRPRNKKVFHDTIRNARKLKKICNSEICRKSGKRFCHEIKEEERVAQHTSFWNDMDWEQRKVFVSSLVDCHIATRKRTEENNSRRNTTFIYHLKSGGTRKQVCKKTFLNTFDLGEWSVRSWVIEKKDNAGIHISRENRNAERTDTLRKPKKKEQKDNLIIYLESIPKLPSHYCRKQTDKLYLEPMFTTMTQFFNHYVDYCKEKQITHLSRQVFDTVVSEKKISIFQPKKDACDLCIKYSIGNLKEEEYKMHLDRKEQARLEKNNDKMEAEKGQCIVLTADVQAVKLAPFFNASALYYKTKLCVHNYTVFNLATHDATCYWWNESQGELVASVFTSCLIDYINKFKDSGKPIIIWTDCCTYQNRNSVISSALLLFSMNNNIVIEQKYLERGHTQMECDSIHAVIENKLKNRVIHLPSDYIAVTKEARQNPRPYDVKYLSFDFFSDYASNKLCTSIRPGLLTVNEIRCLKYLPEGKIMYKCVFSDDYKDLPQRIRKLENNSSNFVPPKLYKNAIKIKNTKWQHLQQLKEVLPKECHHFYDSLPHQ